jgi:hypothetical protein
LPQNPVIRRPSARVVIPDRREHPMKTLLLVPLALLAAACLENEEELEVHADGSVDARLRAKGGLEDLTDGYPLPLGPPWRALGADTQRWIARVGAATGGAGIRERARAAGWPVQEGEEGKEPEVELAVAAHFDSVAELPSTYAVEDEPYRAAHLARTNSLAIEVRGHARVYVFERVYRGFQRARFDPFGNGELPEQLRRKLEAGEALTAADETALVDWLRAGLASAGEAFLRASLEGLFTARELPGERLAAAELDALLSEVRAEMDRVLDADLVLRLLAAVRAKADGGEAFAELDREWRAALRAGLGGALASRGVAEPARNAALYALEWQLTAFDAAGDLGDESFALELRLPGTIVGGNFTRLEDGAARFEFDGRALQEGDLTLRAVSVLE